MLLYFIFAVAIVSFQNVLAQMGLGMGPLNIHLVDIRPCESQKNYLDVQLVELEGNKQGLTMDIDIPQPMDETVSYQVVVDKVQNGQIQKGIFRHGGKNACEDLNKFVGILWTNLLKAGGVDEGCPIPAGKYHVEKYPYNQEELNIKTFLYGRFLATMQMFIQGESVVCQVVEFTNSRPGESF